MTVPVRYAYVILAFISILLGGLAIWVSIIHDRSDNQKFCDVAVGNTAVIRAVLDMGNADGVQTQLEEAYRRYLLLQKSLGCKEK